MAKVNKTGNVTTHRTQKNIERKNKPENKNKKEVKNPNAKKTALILTALTAAAVAGIVLVKRHNPKNAANLLDGARNITPELPSGTEGKISNEAQNVMDMLQQNTEGGSKNVASAVQSIAEESKNVQELTETLVEEQKAVTSFVLPFDPTIKCLPAPKPLLMLPEASSVSKDPIGLHISRLLNQNEEMMKKERHRVLKNGIGVHDTIISSGIGGERVFTTYDRPVNGVQSIITHKFVNGDISKMEVFDSNKNLIKEISYSRSYLKDTNGSLMQIHIRDAKKGTTVVNYNYSKKTGHLKNIVTVNPDGSEKVAVIEKTGLKERFIEGVKQAPKRLRGFVRRKTEQLV